MNHDAEIAEKLRMLGPNNVKRVLEHRHGLPGYSDILANGPIPSGVAGLRTRFNLNYWFAKPPEGTPWPTRYMHHTFETCWLAQHDMSLGDKLHDQTAALPEQTRLLMIWQMSGIQWWLLQNGITVFVEDHIAEACEHTDVLECVTGSDIHEAYPHMMFALSEKSRLTNRRGDDWINYILVNFVSGTHELVAKYGHGTMGVSMPTDCKKFVIFNSFWKSGFVSSAAFPLHENKNLKDEIGVYTQEYIDDEFRTHALNAEGLAEEHAETAELGRKVAALVFNCCLLMQSYPEYIQRNRDADNRRLMLRGHPAPTAYRLNDRTAPIKPPPVDESPRPHAATGDDTREIAPHWRRGHWRRQPHSDAWEVEHPDIKVVLFPDGRRAHMVRIPPLFIRGVKQ